MQNCIKDITAYLFNCNFFDENFDPDGEEVHLDKAHELQKTYSWNDIITEWHCYLYSNCHTPEEIINYANLFFYYEGADDYNPEPYRFIAYMYAHVDMNIYWDLAGDLFDSIAINILSYQQLINLKEDPYYNPLKDPKILKEMKIWQSER